MGSKYAMSPDILLEYLTSMFLFPLAALPAMPQYRTDMPQDPNAMHVLWTADPHSCQVGLLARWNIFLKSLSFEYLSKTNLPTALHRLRISYSSHNTAAPTRILERL